MLDAFWDKSPLRSVINGLLYEPSKLCEKDKALHALFIGLHLVVGLLALAALPVVILIAGASETASLSGLTLLPLWMLAPLLSVVYLSKTGKLANAFLLTSITTAAFVCWIASMTGGLQSPHLIWLAVIPLEVALSGNQKIVKQSLLICLSSVGLLWLLSSLDVIHFAPLSRAGLSLVGASSILAAILYAGMLAIRIEMLHRSRLCDLQAEEMRYRSIADTISDMITRHDRSGDVTFASPTAEQLINAKPEALLGNGLFQKIHIPDRPAFLQALSDCMNSKSLNALPITVELRIMAEGQEDLSVQSEADRNEELRWCEMKCAPERNEQGIIIGAICATRDISKRKQQALALDDARKEAEMANDSKTRFLANVTHELRTPLNTIIGFSEILCHPDLIHNNEAKTVEYAELIHNGGNHLLQLVNALLDMSRIESGNFEVAPQHFDIKDLSESCCKMMQADAETRGITLYSKNDEDIRDVCLDPRACRQILLNLITNALKFSDRGDKVMVSVKWARNRKGAKLDNKIEMVVTDSGIGIDKADIPRLGKPFVQAENSLQRRFEGAGIGLSIVKGLSDLQHGSMIIDSVLGKGTTVTITLPVDMKAIENPSSENQQDNAVVALEHSKEKSVEEATRDKANKVA
nr:ATP-binding protein [uncultured Cohaesibacter sp.]